MKYPDILEGLVLQPGEFLVLVTDDLVSSSVIENVPEPLKGRVLFVSGAKAHAVAEEAAQELVDKFRAASEDL